MPKILCCQSEGRMVTRFDGGILALWGFVVVMCGALGQSLSLNVWIAAIRNATLANYRLVDDC